MGSQVLSVVWCLSLSLTVWLSNFTIFEFHFSDVIGVNYQFQFSTSFSTAMKRGRLIFFTKYWLWLWLCHSRATHSILVILNRSEAVDNAQFHIVILVADGALSNVLIKKYEALLPQLQLYFQWASYIEPENLLHTSIINHHTVSYIIHTDVTYGIWHTLHTLTDYIIYNISCIQTLLLTYHTSTY